MTARQDNRPAVDTGIGPEIQCAKCREYWPRDREFFYFTNGHPHSWCKACYRSDPKIVARRASAVEAKTRARGLIPQPRAAAAAAARDGIRTLCELLSSTSRFFNRSEP